MVWDPSNATSRPLRYQTPETIGPGGWLARGCESGGRGRRTCRVIRVRRRGRGRCDSVFEGERYDTKTYPASLGRLSSLSGQNQVFFLIITGRLQVSWTLVLADEMGTRASSDDKHPRDEGESVEEALNDKKETEGTNESIEEGGRGDLPGGTSTPAPGNASRPNDQEATERQGSAQHAQLPGRDPHLPLPLF